MKIKLPTRTHPLGVSYSIIYKTKVTENNDELSGLCDPHKRTIEISLGNNLTAEEVFSTLFHETIHALLYQSGISSILDNEQVEEGLVVMLENSLAPHIKQKSGLYSDWREIEIEGK